MRVREFKYLENIFLSFLFLSNFPLKHLLYTCAVVTKEIYIRSFPTNQIVDRLKCCVIATEFTILRDKDLLQGQH